MAFLIVAAGALALFVTLGMVSAAPWIVLPGSVGVLGLITYAVAVSPTYPGLEDPRAGLYAFLGILGIVQWWFFILLALEGKGRAPLRPRNGSHEDDPLEDVERTSATKRRKQALLPPRQQKLDAMLGRRAEQACPDRRTSISDVGRMRKEMARRHAQVMSEISDEVLKEQALKAAQADARYSNYRLAPEAYRRQQREPAGANQEPEDSD